LVRMRGGVCSIDTPCAEGARCTAIVFEIKEPMYFENARVQFVAATTQSWPQNIRLAVKSRGQGLGMSCNLRVAVDLYKTGIVVEHEPSWRFEDIGELTTSSGLTDGAERPLWTIRRETWSRQAGAVASLTGDFVAEMTLPVGPLVEALEAVSVGVKANVAYVESRDHAVEGRFSVNADVHVARNVSSGYAVVSLPFNLFVRADVPSLAGYMPMAAARAEVAGKQGNMHLFLKDHALTFEAAPDSQAAAGILGHVHVLGWRRDYKERRHTGGSRRLTAADSAPTNYRRLIGLFGIEDILGFELQSLKTHHRLYFDDDAFLGVDFKMVEGPPFVIALGARIESSIANDLSGDGSSLVANVTFTVHDDDETAAFDVRLTSKGDGESDVALNFNTALDIKSETFDVHAALESSDVNITLHAGIHADDGLVFLNAGVEDVLGVNISGDFDDLVFQADVVIDELIEMNFMAVKDSVDLDASLRFGDSHNMTAAIDYRRVDVADDVENFTASMRLIEVNGEEYGEARVMNWTKPASDDMATIVSKSESSVTFALNHGRRRTSAAGGIRELTSHMSILPECQAQGDGSPSGSALLCCDEGGGSCESCCKDTMQGMMVDMMGATVGSSMGTEGLAVTLTDIAGSDGDMDFVAILDTTDEASPRVKAELRVVGSVSTLDFEVNETNNESLTVGLAQWKEITGGHSANVSISERNSSEMLIKAVGEWSETKDEAGLITRTGAGSIRNGSDVLQGGGSGTWTESADGETHTLVWKLYNESQGQFLKGDAHLDLETGAGINLQMEPDQEMLVGEIFIQQSTNGDIDARAHASLDGEEMLFVIGDWNNSSGWGGDLNLTAIIQGNETIMALATLADTMDAKTASLNVSTQAEHVIGGFLALSDGGLSVAAPAFVNLTVREGADASEMLVAHARITNPDFALDTDDSRVILMKNPVEAYAHLDLREDDDGTLKRMAMMHMNITEVEAGNGSVVNMDFRLIDGNSTEEIIWVDAACNSSDPTQMEVGAEVHFESEFVLNMTGVLPYEGDYMSGNMEIHLENHTQAISTKISRGFLVQSTKPTGYDALWLNFGTVIDDTALLNVTDLYIERGPDIAWSGVGWKFTLAEKNSTEWRTTYSHSFDIDFVPGTPPPLSEDAVTTKFDLAVEIADMSTFDVQSVVSSIAAASDIETADVIVEKIVFEVKASYAFDSSVTPVQAKKTVALANNVLESQVTLTAVSRRRLDSSRALSSLRRLADVQYETVITTTDTAQATAVMASSANVATLTAALAEVVEDAPAPLIKAAPKVEVTITTALVSETGTAVEAPTASTLNSELSSALNQTVETEVQASSSDSESSDSGSSEELRPAGTADGALLLSPLLSVLCVSPVAALTAAF